MFRERFQIHNIITRNLSNYIIVTLSALVTLASADFFAGQVNLNSYYREALDVNRDASLYQKHSYSFTATKGPLTFLTSSYYSDLNNTRYHSYQRNYQIGQSTVAYNPENSNYDLWLGRNYLRLVGRHLPLDGAGASLKLGHWAKLSGLAGFQTPSYYQESPFDFASDNGLAGASVELLPFRDLQITLDVHKSTNSDSGASGLETIYRPSKKYLLSANGLFDFDSKQINQSQAMVRHIINQDFYLSLVVGNETYALDSHLIYESLIHADYKYLKVDATFFLLKKISLSTAWGIQSVDDDVGNLLQFSLSGWGAHTRYQGRFNSDIFDSQISMGYETPLLKFVRYQLETGYHGFQFQKAGEDKWVYFLETGPEFLLQRKLRILLQYQFENSPVYKQDHRVRLGMKYNVFKAMGPNSIGGK